MRASIALALLFLIGCTSLQHREDPGARLADLIVERLSWMDEVAAIKRSRKLPIVDAKREAELLAAMEKKGVAAGLPAKSVRCFFVGQMEAAKECQQSYLLHMLIPKSHAKGLPDLATEVRPALDKIGVQMIETLLQARAQKLDPETARAAARMELAKRHHSESVIRPALAGLVAGIE
jgi:chorismate mutase-like protein